MTKHQKRLLFDTYLYSRKFWEKAKLQDDVDMDDAQFDYGYLAGKDHMAWMCIRYFKLEDEYDDWLDKEGEDEYQQWAKEHGND